MLSQGFPKVLKIPSSAKSPGQGRGCETPSGNWAGNSSTESDTKDPGRVKWTYPNSAEGTEKSPAGAEADG